MAGEIYIDPNVTSAAVIRVGGGCYVQVGASEQEPQELEVEDEFEDCDSCQREFPCFPDNDLEATDAELEAMYPDVIAQTAKVACCECFVENTEWPESMEIADFTLPGRRFTLVALPVQRTGDGHCRLFQFGYLYYSEGNPANQPPDATPFVKMRTHYVTTACEETGYATDWDPNSGLDLELEICCTSDGWQWRTLATGIYGQQDIFNNAPMASGWLGNGGEFAEIPNGIAFNSDCDGTTLQGGPCGGGWLKYRAVAPGIP